MNKGLIFEIRRFTVHDGPGIRTTVFFKGCPLSCWWCHNPESQSCQPEESLKTLSLDEKRYKKKEVTGHWMSAGEVMDEVIRDRIFYTESSGGVTFSGGEPLLQPVFLMELLKACKANGFHTTIDTSGYTDANSISSLFPYTDLFLYDLKLMDDSEHIHYTGVSNRTILDNLNKLIADQIPLVIRVPVVRGITDTRKNLEGIKSFLAGGQGNPSGRIKISLLPYHSTAKQKYQRFHIENRLKNLKDVKKESLEVIKKEFEEAGYFVSIGE